MADSRSFESILSEGDYYPFGMLNAGRNWSSGNEYRYGFNGQEQDDEVLGNGNLNTTEFREYDCRLGRWYSIDPNVNYFASQSPYVAYDDNPIFYKDPLGAAAEKNGDNHKKLERRREKERKFENKNQRKIENKMKREDLTEMEVIQKYQYKKWIDTPKKYNETTGAKLEYPDIRKDGSITWKYNYAGNKEYREDLLVQSGTFTIDYDARGLSDRITVSDGETGVTLYDSGTYVYGDNSSGDISFTMDGSYSNTVVIKVTVNPHEPPVKFGDSFGGRDQLSGGKIKITIHPSSKISEIKPIRRNSKWLGHDIKF